MQALRRVFVCFTAFVTAPLSLCIPLFREVYHLSIKPLFLPEMSAVQALSFGEEGLWWYEDRGCSTVQISICFPARDILTGHRGDAS